MIDNIYQRSEYWLDQLNRTAQATQQTTQDVAYKFMDQPENKKLLVAFLNANKINATISDDTLSLMKMAHNLLTVGTSYMYSAQQQSGMVPNKSIAFQQLLDGMSQNVYATQLNEAAVTPKGTAVRSAVYGFDFGDGIAVAIAGTVGYFGTPAAGVAVLGPVDKALGGDLSGSSTGTGTSSPTAPFVKQPPMAPPNNGKNLGKIKTVNGDGTITLMNGTVIQSSQIGGISPLYSSNKPVIATPSNKLSSLFTGKNSWINIIAVSIVVVLLYEMLKKK